MTEKTSMPVPSEGTPGTPEAVVGLATDGAYYLVVAQFPTIEEAQAVYADLEEVERGTSLRIDGVVIASCDAEGKVSLAKATEHSTKHGLKWGVIGGVVLGVLFPPSILASAVTLGTIGAISGKARNLAVRWDISEELAKVMTPNTAGIVALVEDTAVVEIEKALAKADRIVTKAVDKQIVAELDREAAASKEAVTGA
jgi:uncharacterized membrane protein